MDKSYQIVRLANGTSSVRALAEGETFHPVIGPVAEAEALYVRQVGLADRLRAHRGEFVIWDVGLGAAANVLTVIRAADGLGAHLRFLSFDHTLEPLRFALEHRAELGYFDGFEPAVGKIIEHNRAEFSRDASRVDWEAHVGDFPSLLASAASEFWPKPHLILFDAFSPARNAAMWTHAVFAGIHRLLDPDRPCVLPTYSRSTLLRVTLLLAGFWVGAGHATGEKEETTLAANRPELIATPLDRKWLGRARRSNSAEPLWSPVYRQAPLSSESWDRLLAHPQFR
jgi:tRNA U34 5-methylaminomethyl-2-thiouridine-forming methyltransferase MnmC